MLHRCKHVKKIKTNKDIEKAKGFWVDYNKVLIRSTFAQESQVTRQNIYRMLSEKGNPRLKNFRSIIDAMGLQVKLEAKSR